MNKAIIKVASEMDKELAMRSVCKVCGYFHHESKPHTHPSTTYR